MSPNSTIPADRKQRVQRLPYMGPPFPRPTWAGHDPISGGQRARSPAQGPPGRGAVGVVEEGTCGILVPAEPGAWGGAAAAGSRGGAGGSSPGVAQQEAGRARLGGARGVRACGRRAGPRAAEYARAGLGGQPRRTAAAGARGAGRKSLFTQTAHRLGNNAVKEVSRLGLTAPTSCSHTQPRGKKKKKKRGARERKKRGGIRISLQEQQTVCRRLSAWKVGGFRLGPPRNSPRRRILKAPPHLGR
jgi:hypothetical protein